jgi:hypothetical protein
VKNALEPDHRTSYQTHVLKKLDNSKGRRNLASELLTSPGIKLNPLGGK